MSTTRNAIISGVIATAIAIALVSAATLSPGLLGLENGSSSTTSTAQSGTGTLAVMLTDPPTVPNGVTALFATYNNLAVHVSDTGNQSGWHDLNTTGTINLMGVINVSQTIASAKLPNGEYNALRLNITSAKVTYNGANYTALLVENKQGIRILTIPIDGGVEVKSLQSSTMILDLTPTVLLLGSTSNPTFAFIGTARAYTLPAQSVPGNDDKVGARVDLSTINGWIEHESHFEISAVTLTPGSLSITVQNNGNASLVFRLAAVSATNSEHGGQVPIWADSAAFVVEPNGTLAVLNGAIKIRMVQMVAAGGYLLAPHSSAKFTYTGILSIGPIVLHTPHGQDDGQENGNSTQTLASLYQNSQGVVAGQKYIVSIQGNGVLAQTAVIAS
jgi:hypothetical protein